MQSCFPAGTWFSRRGTAVVPVGVSPWARTCRMGPVDDLIPAAGERRIGPLERFAVAVLAAVLATGLHLLVYRRFGDSFDPILLLVVAFSTWYGGFGPGLVTLVLLGLGAALVRHTPTVALDAANDWDLAGISMYGVAGLAVSALIASLMSARRRAERAAARTERLQALNLALAPALSSDAAAAIIIRHAMQALNARAGAIAHNGGEAGASFTVRSPGHPGNPEAPDGPLAEVL